MLPKITHILASASILLVLSAAVSYAQEPDSASLKMTHTERSLAPGEIVLLRVQSPQPLSEMRTTAFAREFPMFPEEDGRSWAALIGIDMETRAGMFPVEVLGTDKSGRAVRGAIRFQVIAKSFPRRELTVDPKFVNPPAKALERIKQEAERVRAIFDSVTPERFWNGKFLAPVPGPVISEFGKRSVYNGQQRSSHAGTDYRGAAGTPIRAPNGGTVVLATDLYYSGNTVIIDHGLGLFTYFGHMSEFQVKAGDRVERGAVVGKVGATGLVTGPHLHWSVRLSGTRVDPVSLLDVLGSDNESKTTTQKGAEKVVKPKQKITTFLMFSERAEEAMKFYTSLFDNSEILAIRRYGPGESGAEGSVMLASFSLNGQQFMAIDSAGHAFTFTPAVSLYVSCETEAEIDRLYRELSANGQVLMPLGPYPFSPRYGWVSDRFGVSWQLSLGSGNN